MVIPQIRRSTPTASESPTSKSNEVKGTLLVKERGRKKSTNGGLVERGIAMGWVPKLAQRANSTSWGEGYI